MRIFKMLVILLMVTICFSQFVKANNPGNEQKECIEVSPQGCVIDAITNKPFTWVIIKLASNKLNTGGDGQSNASGRLTLEKLPPGDITVLFAKKGYRLFKSDLLSLKDGNAMKIFIDFQPAREGGNDMWQPLLKLLE